MAPPARIVRSAAVASASGFGAGRIRPSAIQPPGRSARHRADEPFLQVLLREEEARDPHAVERVDVVDCSDLLPAQRDAVTEPGVRDVVASVGQRRVPRVDPHDGRRGPHTGGRHREEPDAGADVEEARHGSEVGVRRRDGGRHHRRTAAPTVEDRRIGERPSRRAVCVLHQVERLVQVHADQAEDHPLLGWRQRLEAGDPRRRGDRAQGRRDLGRRLDAGLLHRHLGSEGGEGLGCGSPLHDDRHHVFEWHVGAPLLGGPAAAFIAMMLAAA